LSFKFDDELSQRIVDTARSELRNHGIEAVVAGDLNRTPPPEIVRSTLLACDALLVIITSSPVTEWINNEIGIAYAADMPIYGLVKESISVGGILPGITSYFRFRRTFWESEIRERIAVVASEMLGLSGIVLAVVEPAEVLTSSTGRLVLGIRPRNLPSGEEVLTIHIPPGFRIPINENPVATRLTGPAIISGLPENVCRLAARIGEGTDPLAGFLKIEVTLVYPDVTSHLHSGWVELSLRYTAPEVAGKYRFYGGDRVVIGGRNSQQSQQDASAIDIPPVIVKGEVAPITLSGIIFVSDDNPLRGPGLVRADMTMRVDPYTGDFRSDLPRVRAVCYLSAKDEGKYRIFGLAPGIYNIYASVFGSNEVLIASGLRLETGRQPSSLDGHLR